MWRSASRSKLPHRASAARPADDEGDTKVGGLDPQEKEELSKAISEAQEKLDRLSKIRRERDEVLKDLKEKVCIRSSRATRPVLTVSDPK